MAAYMATEKQLDYIASLRIKKDLTNYPGNINDLWSDYISFKEASFIIDDLLKLDDKKEEQKVEHKPRKKTSLKKGGTVDHHMYGSGKIVDAKKDVVTVDFGGQKRKFPASYFEK